MQGLQRLIDLCIAGAFTGIVYSVDDDMYTVRVNSDDDGESTDETDGKQLENYTIQVNSTW